MAIGVATCPVRWMVALHVLSGLCSSLSCGEFLLSAEIVEVTVPTGELSCMCAKRHGQPLQFQPLPFSALLPLVGPGMCVPPHPPHGENWGLAVCTNGYQGLWPHSHPLQMLASTHCSGSGRASHSHQHPCAEARLPHTSLPMVLLLPVLLPFLVTVFQRLTKAT